MPRSWLSPTASNFAALTSLATLAVVAIRVVLAGAASPGYSHVSQFISELGARGAPHEWGTRFLGFLPAGVLLLAFCGFAHRALPRSRRTTLAIGGLALYAAGYLVAAAFPCDPGCRPPQPSTSQVIHNVGGAIGYLLAPVFLFALACAARTWRAARHLVVAGYVASGLALLGVLTLSPSSPAVGLSQRLIETAVLGWTALCGVYLARRGPRAA
jgi:hypothetical protein